MAVPVNLTRRTEQGPITVGSCGLMTRLPLLRDLLPVPYRWEQLEKVFLPEGNANVNLECPLQATMTMNSMY